MGWRFACCCCGWVRWWDCLKGEVDVANSGFGGFLEAVFVATGNVYFCSVGFEGLGDDEAEAGAACLEYQLCDLLILRWFWGGDRPPVTTATSPLTSYKSCLLNLEVVAMAIRVLVK
jgi:hypothetical protein